MFSFFKSKSEAQRPFIYQNERDIHTWLKDMRIKHYHLTPNKEVNVEEDVYLIEKDITFLPVQFNIIKGSFICAKNKLITLQGAPRKVYGDFIVADNQLTSLEFCPKKVKGRLDIQKNKLTNLNYFPYEVGGLVANNNLITCIKGMSNAEFSDKNSVVIYLLNNPLSTLESLVPIYQVVENNRFRELKINSDVLHQHINEYIVDYDKKFAIIKELFMPFLEKETLNDKIKEASVAKNKLKI